MGTLEDGDGQVAGDHGEESKSNGILYYPALERLWQHSYMVIMGPGFKTFSMSFL